MLNAYTYFSRSQSIINKNYLKWQIVAVYWKSKIVVALSRQDENLGFIYQNIIVMPNLKLLNLADNWVRSKTAVTYESFLKRSLHF